MKRRTTSQTMHDGGLARAASEALLETMWPTRCAVCDKPGAILCERCRAALPYIDAWRACRRCGAPLGRIQCTECNPVTLTQFERSEPPFDACVCAVTLNDDAHRITRLYKDAGERRLSSVMAEIVAHVAPPEWFTDADALTWVPATRIARRRRGFDHAEELARDIANVQRALLHTPIRVEALLDRPSVRDQRSLTRAERIENISGRFHTKRGASPHRNVIVVDDVYTTGATLFAAADALREAGVHTVRCLTFARTI